MNVNPLLFLFDIDGTLLHTQGSSRRAVADAFAEVLGQIPDIESYELAGRTDYRIFHDLLGQLPSPAVPHEVIRDRLLPTYVRYLQTRLHQGSVTVYQGVREFLDLLQGSPAYRVALLTGNHEAGARVKLQAAGLSPYFPDYIGAFGDDSIEREPLLPKAISEASRYFKIPFLPQDAVVVGDSVHDIRCAQAGGAAVIAVATGYTVPALLTHECPDLLLPDLSAREELLRFLAKLTNRQKQS